MNSLEIYTVSLSVAVITGFISFIGLVISKENKISEFRQTWIDELRKDISDYISYIEKHEFYFTYTSKIDKENGGSGVLNKEGLDLYLRESHIVISLYTRIVLRLNRNKHKDILEILGETNKSYSTSVYNPNYYSNNRDLSKYNAALRDKSEILLKNEWERVKKGEPWFRVTKYAVLVVIAIFVLLLLLPYVVCDGRKHATVDNARKEMHRIDNAVIK